MKNARNSAVMPAALLLSLLLAVPALAATKSTKYACLEANPASLCTAANTCGSASTTCEVNVKRTNYGASTTPDLPGAKGNALFCVHVGTTVKWGSSSRNTGFVVDMSDASPFDPDGAIIGGTSKDTTVVAKTSGCYKYSVGACISGAVNGMCANSSAELVVIP